MGKDTRKIIKKQLSVAVKNDVALDKLAQLGTDSKKALKSRAKAKFLAEKISVGLANIEGSMLTKSYWNSYRCNSFLSIADGRVTAQYCNSRWCLVCNRIRMAKMINGYMAPLVKLEDKYFVTLTVPNCPGDELGVTIRDMNHCFKSIMETMKRRKQRGQKDYQIVGIRKLECTYNEKTNTFHPHFHLLVDNKECAEDIVYEWLDRNPLCNGKAQDCRKADDGSMIEMFKYFAKIVSKVGGCYTVHLKSLDIIFTAMVGLRVFQPMGIKKVSEDIEGLISDYIDKENGEWKWFDSDWYSTDGEGLTGYIPDDKIQNLANNIK
jgi:plasmid rolling circle replication initiator protein Rep